MIKQQMTFWEKNKFLNSFWKQRKKVLHGLALVSVLFLLISLRYFFAPGITFSSNLDFVQESRLLFSSLNKTIAEEMGIIQTFVELRAEFGIAKLIRFFPITLIYNLLGVRQLSIFVFSVMGSVISGLALYAIAARYISKSTGILAMLLWSLLPIEIYSSGHLGTNTFVLGVSLLVFFLWLTFNERPKLASLLGILGGLLFLSSQQIWTAALLVLILTSWLAKRLFGLSQVYKVYLVAFAILVILGALTNVNLHEFTSVAIEFLGFPGNFQFLILGIVINTTAKKSVKNLDSIYPLFVGAAIITTPIFAFSKTPVHDLLYINNSYLLFILALLIIRVAAILKAPIQSTKLNLFAIVLSVLLPVLIWVSLQKEAALLIDHYTSWWGMEFISFFILAEIMAGFSILLILFIPVSIGYKNSSARQLLVIGMLAVFSVGSLAAANELRDYDKAAIEAASNLLVFLDNQELELPLVAQNREDYQILGFVSGFDFLSNQGQSLELKRMPNDMAQIESAYIVLSDIEKISIPNNWVSLGVFGDPGKKRLSLYRSLDETLAGNLLTEAEASIIAGSVNPKVFLDLYRLHINLGNYCEAYEEWITYQQLQNITMSFINVVDGENCFTFDSEFGTRYFFQSQGESYHNLVAFPGVYRGEDYVMVEELNDPVLRIEKKYDYYYDPRTYDVTETLEGGKFYLFSVSIKTDAAAQTLYTYDSDSKTEIYLEKDAYPTFTDLSILFYLAPGANNQSELHFSPYLIDGFDYVFLESMDLKMLDLVQSKN